MLPPVRTVSSSSSSYQSQSSLSSTGQQSAGASHGAPLDEGEHDVNANISGRLGILLLAGREKMADNLSQLADALGKAIDLPRRDGEANTAYAMRLADALASLTPRQRADVQKLLESLIQGIKLRFLIEALRNPTGPQAARIVAYMEMAGYKDRDLVARSVVTSYRQNDGASDTARPGPVIDVAAPAAAMATRPAAAPRPAVPLPGPALETPNGHADAADAIPAAPETKGDDSMTSEPQLAQRVTKAGAMEAQAYANAEHAGAAQPQPAAMLSVRPDLEPRTMPAPAAADARSLQDILKKAFEGGESGDATIEARATAQMLEPETLYGFDHRADAATRKADAQRQLGAARAMPSPETVHVLGPAAEAPDEFRPTLLVLKGWTEVINTVVETTAETLRAVFDTELARLPADDAALSGEPHGGTAPADIPTAAAEAFEPQSTDIDYGDDEEFSAMRLRGASVMQDDGSAEGSFFRSQPLAAPPAQDPVARVPQTPEQQVAAALTLPVREPVPYGMVLYPPAPELHQPDDVEEHRRYGRDDGEGQEDEQQASAGQDDDRGDDRGDDDRGDEAGEQAGPGALVNSDADADADAAGADRAYDLYQRMAGWS